MKKRLSYRDKLLELAYIYSVKEIQDYAEAQGYDLVLGDGALYVSSAVNITEDVLNAVIANYEVSQ